MVDSSRNSFCPRGHEDVKGVNLPAGGLGWWCRDCASGRYSTMFFLAGDWELLEFGSWPDFWYGNDFHAAFWGWPEWISSGDEFSLTLGSYDLSVSPPQRLDDFVSSWGGWLWGPRYEDGLGIPASSQKEAEERLLAEVRQLDDNIVPRLSDSLNLTTAQARIQHGGFVERVLLSIFLTHPPREFKKTGAFAGRIPVASMSPALSEMLRAKSVLMA